MSIPYIPKNTDELVQLISKIFGKTISTIIDKNTLSTPQDNLIATLMQSFNVFLWIISGIILSAVIIWQIGKTANKDHNQKINLLNEPLKNISGIILLMPTAYGYNIASLIILTASLWSIKGANDIYTQAINQQIHHAINLDAKYFIEQKVSLSNLAQEYIKISYCTKVLNNIYNKSYGSPDQAYANITPQINNIIDSQADQAGNYTSTIKFTDTGKAQIAGQQALCGQIDYKRYKSTNSKTSKNTQLTQNSPEFNEAYTQAIDNLKQQTQNIWNEQIETLMTQIDEYIDKNLPTDPYDIKYNTLKDNINEINDIIKTNQAKLAQALSDATNSNEGVSITQIQKLYQTQMKQGGILNVIGYRQHLGRMRTQILDILTDQYIMPNTNGRFEEYLPNDTTSQNAQSVYYGVINNVQQSINTQTNNSNNCPLDFDKIKTILQDHNQINQIANEYKKVTSNQIATILNIILGKTDIICGGYSNITNSNQNNQSESLDRLQKAGTLLKNLAEYYEKTKNELENKQSQQNNIKNATNINTIGQSKNKETNAINAKEQNIINILKKLESAKTLLKSSSTWLSIVLPSIMDFFLILGIAIFPIKIVMEMVGASVNAMMLFVPQQKSWQSMVKQFIGIILYLPLVIIGYFSGNVILNYVLELGISLSFESMQYSISQGGGIDLEQLNTVIMIFVSIGGAITMMCASMVLGLPAMINRLLQIGESEGNISASASTKMDNSTGSSGAGTAASGQVFGAGSHAGVGRGERDVGNNDSLGTQNQTYAPDQALNHGQEVGQGSRVNSQKDFTE
jgi:conjugal transfer/type IV secretion protein DotA/TraY